MLPEEAESSGNCSQESEVIIFTPTADFLPYGWTGLGECHKLPTINNTLMKIYFAIQGTDIAQGFGKDKTASSLIPLYNSLGLIGHDGVDERTFCKNYVVKQGGQCYPIFCDIDGYAIITAIYTDVKTGYGIIALDGDNDHKHVWWHFDSIAPGLKIGDRIEGGDLLGVSGTTGFSTGPHLHRGLYSFSEPYDNGYHGAIDPTPYLVPIFINDLISNLTAQIGLMQQIINYFKSLFKK